MHEHASEEKEERYENRFEPLLESNNFDDDSNKITYTELLDEQDNLKIRNEKEKIGIRELKPNTNKDK